MPQANIFRALWGKVVIWFSSTRNTIIFFVAVMVSGSVIGLYQRQAISTSLDGQVPLQCLQSQPKQDVYKSTEFFLLTCPHCKQVESLIHYGRAGSQNGISNIVHRHVIWDESHEAMARFVFALEKIGRPDLIYELEVETQQSKSVFLPDSEDGQRFIKEQALNVETIKLLIESPQADQFIAETKRMQTACHIDRVPAMLKAGEITTPAGAGGYQSLADKIVDPVKSPASVSVN